MLDELLFPGDLQLGIQQIEKVENSILIWICCAKKTAVCPECGRESDRLHSAYERHPKDLPFVGQAVQLCARVRRFFCDNGQCARRTFAERWPDFLAVKARRTQRLMAEQRDIAFALGGEAGRQLCSGLGMSISGDTLIRAIRQSPEEAVSTPRVLGIDDWAKRKGQEYGTILVDLEAHEPVDVLDSRTVEAVAAWLKEHPGVDIVSRDRGAEYIKGVSEGAPEADQVADRWHLLSNLREALVAVLETKPVALKAAAQDAPAEDPLSVAQETLPDTGELCSTADERQASTVSSAASQETVPSPPSPAQPTKTARQERRQARFDQVHALYQATGSVRAVARQLNMSRRAVKRYLNAERCPQYPQGRIRSSKLTPYLKSLQARWQAGCTNASQLWRDIRQEGFTGSRGLVARWAAQQRTRLPVELRYRRQQSPEFQAPLSPPPATVPWSAKRASWLIVKKPPDLDEDEKEALHRMIQSDPQIALAVDLARQFMTMVRHRKQDLLDGWLGTVKNSAIPALISFANGLQKDLSAVRNALRYAWSNGQTEGQVNRLKFIKRSMYGRAKFDLLRKRVLPRAGPT
jgi:transposase